MFEILGSLTGIVALYHLFGCGNPVSLFQPTKSVAAPAAAQSANVAEQTSKFSQAATGQTKAQQDQAMGDIQPVLDYLQSQGMQADQAQVIQQAITNMSGDDLVNAYNHLEDFANGVQQGLINPGDVSTIGGVVATAVQNQYQEGQAFDFGNAMNEITNQMQTALPQYQNTANQAVTAAGDITSRTGALGTLDQSKFNERFAPALQALNQQYTNDSRTLSEQMDARGLQEQGSHAGTGLNNEGQFIINPRITSESSPENHARLMLAQQHDRDLAAATLAAQGQTEAQQVSELNAAQQTPGALSTVQQTQISPLAALSDQTQAEANTQLALHSARGADTSALTGAAGTAATLAPQARAGATGAEQTKLATNVARTQQTLPVAVAQKAVPQTERLGYGAQVTPGVSGAFANLGSQAVQSAQANQAQAAKSFGGLASGALSALTS